MRSRTEPPKINTLPPLADYPKHTCLFILAICLDMGSHWSYHYYNAVKGSHHKNVGSRQATNLASEAVAKVTECYYNCKPLFVYACLSPELFYGSLYFLAAYPEMRPSARTWLARAARWGVGPGFALKQVANVAQMVEAARGVDEGGVDLIL